MTVMMMMLVIMMTVMVMVMIMVMIMMLIKVMMMVVVMMVMIIIKQLHIEYRMYNVPIVLACFEDSSNWFEIESERLLKRMVLRCRFLFLSLIYLIILKFY